MTQPRDLDDEHLLAAFDEELQALCSKYCVKLIHQDSDGSAYLVRADDGESYCAIPIDDMREK